MSGLRDYDSWKTRSDLDDRPEPEEYLSQCDCCGEMKYDCVDLYVSYVGDAHVCPKCRGDEEDC